MTPKQQQPGFCPGCLFSLSPCCGMIIKNVGGFAVRRSRINININIHHKKPEPPKEIEESKKPETFEPNFDMRIQRMNVMFKVLYVFAAAFIAFFAASIKADNKSMVIIISPLTVSVILLLKYIFNELSCLQIGNDCSEEIKRKTTYTDILYSSIWTCLIFIFLTISVEALHFYFRDKLTEEIEGSIALFSLFVYIILSISKQKTKKWALVISNILGTLALYILLFRQYE